MRFAANASADVLKEWAEEYLQIKTDSTYLKTA